MKTILVAIIILSIYHFIFTIILFATRENKTIMAIGACGIWFFIFNIVGYLYSSVIKVNRYKKYKALMIDPNGNLCYCKGDEPEWLALLGYKWANHLVDTFKPSDGWKQSDIITGITDKPIVNIRYTPIKVIRDLKAYKIDKSIIKKAKKIYKNFD